MYAERLLAPLAANPWRAPTPLTVGPGLVGTPDRPLLACATAASVVQTTRGAYRLDALEPDMSLPTRGGAVVRVQNTEAIHFSRMELHQKPQLAPIRFDPGSLPGQLHDVAVLLSPDCPVFNTPDPDTALGATFPASAYCNGATIRHVIPDEGIDYVQLRLSGPCEICIGGLWVRTEGQSDVPTAYPVTATSRYSDQRVFTPLKD